MMVADTKTEPAIKDEETGEITTPEKTTQTWDLINSKGVALDFADQTGYSGRNGDFVGIAAGKTRTGDKATIKSVIQLTEVENVRPGDFFESQGVTYVTAGGRTYRVSDDVECYRRIDNNRYDKANWFTQETGAQRLSACRAFSSDLTIYVDPIGEQVRIVQAN